jgi:hypothetical protein
MFGLTLNRQGINSSQNSLAMRDDLNAQGMGLGHFVFAPYAGMKVCVCITDALADFSADYRPDSSPYSPNKCVCKICLGPVSRVPNILRELEKTQGILTVVEQTTGLAFNRPNADALKALVVPTTDLTRRRAELTEVMKHSC